MEDDEDVSYEVGKRDDGSLWTVTVTCKTPLTEKEFAVAITSLANDILTDKVSFDEAPEMDSH